MRRHQFGLARGFTAATCLAALAACSSGSSTGNKSSGSLPPQAVQSEVAASVASSISSQITAMTTIGASPFLDLFNRVSPGGSVPSVNLGKLLAKRGGTHSREGTDCPAFSPANPVDSDEDGIPDNFTETWGGDCSFTSDSETVAVNGSISISDPTPNTPDLAYSSNINNFGISESGPSASLSLNIDGTLGVSETLSSISVAANYTYNFAETAPNAVTEAITEKLTSTYSFPATSSLLTEADASPIPAGTFSLSGQETFTVNNNTYAFTVSTPTPLAVDLVACPTTGVTSGVVTVGFSGQGATGTATITWTGCGAYTISDN
jgi:hypothetical protein